MSLGRRDTDDEQSVLVQAARRVELSDGVSVNCRTSEDAETLRKHLASLTSSGRAFQALKDATEGAKEAVEELKATTDEVTEAVDADPPVRRVPRKQQG